MPSLTASSSDESSDPNFFEVFPWNDNFSTGNAAIDEQHKRLVALLNGLANTLVNNQPHEIETAFAELAHYADYHFSMEEEIWSECFGSDHWYLSHQLAHASFLPKILEIKERDSGQPLYLIIEDVVKFLIRWLAFHIIDNDKRYALVAREVAQGKTLEEAKIVSDRKMNASSVRVLIDTVLTMYDGLSSRALNLLRERRARIDAEAKLKQAYQELEAANKLLEESAITDQLTQLHNRRHFQSMLVKELSRAQREHSRLTLILFDVDHFKELNDAYGHLAGDQALARVAGKLREICRRAGDYAFRIGGEEFAVLACGNTVNNQSGEFAEIIREEIESLLIPNKDSGIAPVLTISLGIVSLIPDSDDTAEALYKKADQRLYMAKKNGRNRAICG